MTCGIYDIFTQGIIGVWSDLICTTDPKYKYDTCPQVGWACHPSYLGIAKTIWGYQKYNCVCPSRGSIFFATPGFYVEGSECRRPTHTPNLIAKMHVWVLEVAQCIFLD